MARINSFIRMYVRWNAKYFKICYIMSISVTKTVDSRSMALFTNFVHFVWQRIRFPGGQIFCAACLGVWAFNKIVDICFVMFLSSFALMVLCVLFEYCLLALYWQRQSASPEIRHCYIVVAHCVRALCIYCKNIENFHCRLREAIIEMATGCEGDGLYESRIYTKSYLNAYIIENAFN